MAGYATFRLNHGMLVYKRSGFIGMALEADGVLGGSGAQLARQEPSVWIVAIAALHEPFINTMMKSARELLLGFEMAAVAELGLLLLHQKLAFLRIMRRVAVRAANVVLEMCGSSEVAVLLAVGMTPKTTLTDFLGRGILEGENPRFVAAAVDVLFSWPVASFAAVPLRTLLRVQRCDHVRRRFEGLVETLGGHVFVAGLAGFSSYVKRRVGGTLVCFRLARGLCLVVLRQTGKDGQDRTGRREKNQGPMGLPPRAHSHSRCAPEPCVTSNAT
jgi:hypothetical protein